MKKVLYTAGLLILCSVSYAQEPDPADIAEIDKPLPPKVIPKDPPSVFTKVDQMPTPSFDIIKYLSQKIHYPSDARKNNIQGKVVVTFVIDEEGLVVDEKVIKFIGGGCDEEALRVIKAMPK